MPRIEKLNRKDLGGFIESAENFRHSFIKRAAQKVAQVMPLFEGTCSGITLKIEQVGVEELKNIEDESAVLDLLDSV